VRLLASCSCASLTSGYARLHCVTAVEWKCGRGGRKQAEDFLASLDRSKEEKSRSRIHTINGVFNDKLLIGVCLSCSLYFSENESPAARLRSRDFCPRVLIGREELKGGANDLK
jgi:hypothetical protein